MDQETCDHPRIYSKSVRVRENSSDSVLEAVIVLDSEENAGVSGETGDSVSNKVLIEEQETNSDHHAQNEQQNDAITVKDDARCSSNSPGSIRKEVTENFNVMSPHETACVVEQNETVVEENAKRKEEKTVKDSHLIDFRTSDKKCDGERVCRICHLSNDRSPDATDRVSKKSVNMDLIPIGCGCKHELGIAHVYCAEAWFRVKGNRICEICSRTATNVTGLSNRGCMDECNGRRFMDYGDSSFNQRSRCWRGQTVCNFIMACLVTAFMLPWFFHVDMF